MMIALSVFGKQWQQIHFHGCIPVQKFGIGLVLLKFLALHRIGAHHLAHKIIIASRILRVHQRCGGVCLNSILKHTPVGIVAIDDSRSYIGCEGE